MARLYLITDVNGHSCDGRFWGLGQEHRASGEGELFGPGWLTCYRNPILASFLYPIYDKVDQPKLWLVEGKAGKIYNGLVVGSRKLTVARQVDMPWISSKQRVQLAIFASQKAFPEEFFVTWTNQWLRDSGMESETGDLHLGADAPLDSAAGASEDQANRAEQHAQDAAFWVASSMMCPSEMLVLRDQMATKALVSAAAASSFNVTELAREVLDLGA